jgi:hypothetical protein
MVGFKGLEVKSRGAGFRNRGKGLRFRAQGTGSKSLFDLKV